MKELRKNIVEIVGFNMPAERAELLADSILTIIKNTLMTEMTLKHGEILSEAMDKIMVLGITKDQFTAIGKIMSDIIIDTNNATAEHLAKTVKT